MGEVGLYEAMSSCRAVRRLRPDTVPDDVLERVIRAATWAPTGGNVQPWRLIAVRDAQLKRELGKLYQTEWTDYAKQSRAGMESLRSEQRERSERMMRAGDHLAEHFHETPVIAIFCFNPERMALTDAGLGRPSVVGGGSVYPSVQNLLLACRAEGLGCVLTTLLCRCEPQVRELLGIPEPWATCAAIPIGYPASKGHGPISRRPIEKMAFLDRWDTPISGV